MDCPEHERLAGILIQKRAVVAKLTPMVHTEAFQKSFIEQSRALGELEEHDTEHGCQR
jgi:hypothetical protein